MKGVAFVVGAFGQRVDEAEVEGGVVADENRARAFLLFLVGADFVEEALRRFVFVIGRAQRVVGVDAGDFQRFGVDVGAGKGVDVVVDGVGAAKTLVFVEVDQHGGEFEQRVFFGVKAAGLDVNDDRQEAAEALADKGGVHVGFRGYSRGILHVFSAASLSSSLRGSSGKRRRCIATWRGG